MGIIRKIRDRRRFIRIKKEVEKIRESIQKK
jgi:hypothetical protein